jgi:WD40 repeat protein
MTLFGDNFLLTTGGLGVAKLWSVEPFKELRSLEMHDHSATSMDVHQTLPIMVTGGKDGGPAENVCGLDNSVRVWGFLKDVPAGEGEHYQQLSMPSVHVCKVKFVGDKLVVVLHKKGKMVLEIWDATM